MGDIRPVFYTDLSVNYKSTVGGASVTYFANVQNLFDRQPPLLGTVPATSNSSVPTDAALYDTLGRCFTAGIRFNF